MEDYIRFLGDDLRRFEEYFQGALHGESWLHRMALNHVLRGKGKRLRPALVLLSAKAVGEIDEGAMVAATLIELVHTASLVHDDVVDGSETRRGLPSLMQLVGPKRAVLVGDFLLARGLKVATGAGRTDLVDILAGAVEELSCGELEQMETRGKVEDEATYMRVIGRKTASLIEACTRSGAVAAGGSAAEVADLAEYGRALGMAFQIRDDMLDYEGGALIGKPSLQDAREGKVTLPLIAALKKAGGKSWSKPAEALRLVREYGGLEYAREVMKEQGGVAYHAVSRLPRNEATNALFELIGWNERRNK